MAITHAQSIELIPSRSFTYFQRQLRAQLTGSSTMTRFDIIGTARLAFDLFQARADFENPRIRGALSIGVLRLLRWCESTISVYHQQAFRAALSRSLKEVSPMYFAIDSSAPDPRDECGELMQYARELLT